MAVALQSKTLFVPTAPDTFAPRLGAHTLLREASVGVSASADTTGGEKENAFAEGLTFDFWRPGTAGTHWLRASFGAARLSNYLGIAAHNLHQQGAVVKMQHSTDGGVTWTDSSEDFLPATSSPILILYTDVFAAEHRLLIVSTGAVSIGAVHFGEILALDAPLAAPWKPPHLARENRYLNEMSEGGAFLGRTVIAEGAKLELEIPGVGMVWARDKWEDTVRLIETRPFFFAARDAAAIGGVAEAEVFYGWAEDQPIIRYEQNVFGTLSLRARGIVT